MIREEETIILRAVCLLCGWEGDVEQTEGVVEQTCPGCGAEEWERA